MKKMHQFWTLLKFQIRTNHGIFALPIIFIICALSSHFSGTHDIFEHNLDFQLSQTLWMVMAFFFIPQVLAPELSFIRSGTVTRELATVFLLTRATDRYLILRSRSALCYALILITPLSLLYFSLSDPRLDLKESDPQTYYMVLHQVPGSTQVQSMSGVDSSGHSITLSDRNELLSIPSGKTMIASWRLCLFSCLIAFTQAFILLICQLRFQQLLLYGFGFLMLLLPMLIVMLCVSLNFDLHYNTLDEVPFIFFASHQILCWLIAIAFLILGQIWSESRFSRLER